MEMKAHNFQFGKRDIGLLQDIKPLINENLFEKLKERLKKKEGL
ncbi:MAG: hypothetical protein R6U96_14695 [Promethearchaeia archaeon]